MLRMRSSVQVILLSFLSAAVSPLVHAQPCVVPDTAGTVVLPPAGCEYLSPSDVHMIINGLTGPATIEVAAIHKDFICAYQGCGTPFVCNQADNTIFLGGEKECVETTLELNMQGTNALAGFNRTISMPAFMETHTDVRPPGDLQVFNAEMTSLFGLIAGDPDFTSLTIVAGRNQGLAPATGQVTATRLSPTQFNVESFFDIPYQISFQGAPGGRLAGLSGTTPGILRMSTGEPLSAVVPALGPAGMIVLVLTLLVAGSLVLLMKRRSILAA